MTCSSCRSLLTRPTPGSVERLPRIGLRMEVDRLTRARRTPANRTTFLFKSLTDSGDMANGFGRGFGHGGTKSMATSVLPRAGEAGASSPVFPLCISVSEALHLVSLRGGEASGFPVEEMPGPDDWYVFLPERSVCHDRGCKAGPCASW